MGGGVEMTKGAVKTAPSLLAPFREAAIGKTNAVYKAFIRLSHYGVNLFNKL